jgi:hypothetical protein
VRRAFMRAISSFPADHDVVERAIKFQHFSAFVSLELALIEGLDFYADKPKLIQSFAELRAAIEAEDEKTSDAKVS